MLIYIVDFKLIGNPSSLDLSIKRAITALVFRLETKSSIVFHLNFLSPSLGEKLVKIGCAAILALSFTASMATEAAARARPAAIVVDAKNGKVMYEEDPDGLRYPASLTKMMTLYLVFEALESGRISLNSRVPVSNHAANQAPSKLGVRPGQSFTVEQGILALVTRSANDCATAFAEFLGGSEPRFGKMMTAKARSLGMSRTIYYNANGLPDPRQVTTARDQARLGVALRKHFPEYYGYFATRVFKYGRQTIPSHNRLVGSVRGVDGIKTGYTRAAGFNLVTSAQLNGRSIVGVVLGGTSTPQRDSKMRRLVETYLPQASRRGDSDAFVSMQSKNSVETAYADRAAEQPVSNETADADAVSADTQTASATRSLDLPDNGPMPEARYRDEDQASADDTQTNTAQVADADPANTMVPVIRKKTIRFSSRKMAEVEAPVPAEDLTQAMPKTQDKVDRVTTASTVSEPARKGWVIQVGAAPGKTEAMGLLQKAQDKGGRVLRSATPFTVAYNQVYRARFSGFSGQDAAVKACKVLKSKGVSCWASLQ
jgi:D-alanyl-D-alanine carboxypeptidase